jgi:hypothetical protein
VYTVLCEIKRKMSNLQIKMFKMFNLLSDLQTLQSH